jgi:hypothetical protein
VPMSDGTTRTVELTTVVRNGRLVVEFKDSESRTYIGTPRIGAGTATNGRLMVSVIDVDDIEAVRAEFGSRQPTFPVLPPDTSLLSLPNFVPEPRRFLQRPFCVSQAAIA